MLRQAIPETISKVKNSTAILNNQVDPSTRIKVVSFLNWCENAANNIIDQNNIYNLREYFTSLFFQISLLRNERFEDRSIFDSIESIFKKTEQEVLSSSNLRTYNIIEPELVAEDDDDHSNSQTSYSHR